MTDGFTFYSLPQDTNFGKVGSVVVPGYKQSVRNCPWVVGFWMGYCRALERVKSSHEEIVGEWMLYIVTTCMS